MNALEGRPTRAAGSEARAYVWFKAAVFALLGANTAVFLFSGTLSEALDATAWLVLLALFELETGFAGRLRGMRSIAAIHRVRLAAAAAVGAAAIGYVYENEWLDAINSALWIAIVALLEFEVRHPGAVARRRALFVAAAATLYCGLGAMVLIWSWRSEWFYAYDALLWLIALVTIEINILRAGQPRAGRRLAIPGTEGSGP